MHSIKQLCTPRQSVFDAQRRDPVLDIADLAATQIDPNDFFQENFVTDGMRALLDQPFLRLEGKSEQGVFRLKQAMGGGKTHNLLTLGLLAKHPEFRMQVMGKFHQADPNLGPVNVVAFSGRESDAPFGIWGEIAEQLGKKDHFNAHYAPLRAPGQTAWETLFDGQTVLILFDEIAAYDEQYLSRSGKWTGSEEYTSGGTCFGDSGGPVFYGGSDSNLVVGITSFGNSGCAGSDFSYRVDIQDSRDFLSQFTGYGFVIP